MGNDIAYATLDFFAGPEGLDIRPGLLLIADRMDDDMVAPLVAASGLRLLGRSPIAGASERLDEQTRCDFLLLFCPDPDPLLERLLVQIETTTSDCATKACTDEMLTIDPPPAARSSGTRCLANRKMLVTLTASTSFQTASSVLSTVP